MRRVMRSMGNSHSRSVERVKVEARVASIIHLERRNKRFLRDIHFPELPHLFLTGLLLVQELAFPRRVTTVALRRYVFAQC